MKLRADVRAVHGWMTTGAPARAASQKARMIELSNRDGARAILHLGVALQAKVVIPLDQQLLAHRAVRGMTNGATLPERLMFENERTRLVSVASAAGLVSPSHRQPCGRFLDVMTVRIMARNATQLPFNHRMMKRQVQLSMRRKVALVTNRGVFAWIDDELAAAASAADVQAARAVA